MKLISDVIGQNAQGTIVIGLIELFKRILVTRSTRVDRAMVDLVDLCLDLNLDLERVKAI